MNAIQCKCCQDILAPVERAGVRTCACGTIQMRAVPVAEIGHNNLVEVKIFHKWTKNKNGDTIEKEIEQVDDEESYHLFTQVLKIHNGFTQGFLGVHDFTISDKEQNNLFYQNKSQIVIAPLDTPGVKVVEEWSNKELQTTKEYLESVNKTKRYKQVA